MGVPESRSVSTDAAAGDVYRRRDDLVTREIAGETIVVPVGTEPADLGHFFSLNATGAFVWERLDGRTSLAHIHEAVIKSFKVRKREAWQDLAELIGELVRADLVERVE